uniref:protein-serine/threonine phosphatase n=1 Tax=Romanomermis culicivorax TaxID=13658 RepID=A0A915IQD9_ROMCU
PEVSKFASRNLPAHVKNSRRLFPNSSSSGNNTKNIEQSLVDAFLSFDLSLIKVENLPELRRLRQEYRGPPVSSKFTKNKLEANCCSVDAGSSKTPIFEITTTAKSVKNSSLHHNLHNLKAKICHIEEEICRNSTSMQNQLHSAEIWDENLQLTTTTTTKKRSSIVFDILQPGVDSGSTACVLVVDHASQTLYVANVGDSRCVLCRSNGSAFDLSQDHKPDDPSERRRIERAGGWLGFENRVNGILNLSRCFGDHGAKNSSLSSECQIVSAYPDVKVEKLRPDDRFVILACDGIWNSLSSQELVDLVSQRLSKGRTPVQVCEEVCDICLSDVANGSDDTGCDNMTIIIIKFVG